MLVLDVFRSGAGFGVLIAHRGRLDVMPLDRAPVEAVRDWLAERERDGIGAERVGALGGVVDELQAAARPKVAEWVQTLGTLAVQAQRQRDRFLALHNSPAALPSDVRVQLAIEAGRADQRAQDLLRVRGWVYETAGYAADLDAGDARSTRGLGAPQAVIVVPAILAGATLAGWIVVQVRLSVETSGRLASYERLAAQCAQASTPQAREACGQALRRMGDAVQPRDEGYGIGDGIGAVKVLGGIALGIAGVWGVSRLLRFRDARAGERR